MVKFGEKSCSYVFISKIDKLTHCDYSAGDLSIDGMEELSNGLVNHKMCIESIKTLLGSSTYYRQGPGGLTLIGNMVKDVVLGTSPATFSKYTSASMVFEVRDEEPRGKLWTRSIARAASFTSSSPAPSLENKTVQNCTGGPTPSL